MRSPFGPMHDRHLAQKAMFAGTIKELQGCTQEDGCSNSIHKVGCPSHPRAEEFTAMMERDARP